MKEIKEEWRDIPNYEGIYQVSNLGRVKSLARKSNGCNGHLVNLKERILKPSKNRHGYLIVSLNNKRKRKTVLVHQLVANGFLDRLNNKGLVVDHINGVRNDNKLINLRLITNRENTSKRDNKYTDLVGVTFNKNRNKYVAQIMINGKNNFLGHFNNDVDAKKCYDNKLEQVKQELESRLNK